MSYSTAKDQKGVQEGKVTYKFSYTIGSNRYRKQVTCYPSSINKIYRKWERDIIDSKLNPKGPMFFQILDDFLAHVKRTRSKRTYGHYKRVITSLIKVQMKDIPITDIKRRHVKEFIEWRQTVRLGNTSDKPARVAPSTVNHTVNVLSSFFNWCIDMEYLTSNPCYRLRVSEGKTRQWQLTPEQLDELLQKSYERNKNFYYMVIIALCTCFRFGEIMGLRWKDIDFGHNRISLHWQRTKDKETRIVPLIPSLREMLIKMKGKPEEPVINASYEAMQSVSRRLRPELSFAQGEDGMFRFHDLRHIAGQYLFDQGVPIDDIAVIMGHSSVKTTQKHYVHFPRPDMIEKMGRIDNVLPFRRASND